MAVFTPINHNQLDTLLDSFSLGPLLSFEGIAQGTVNSNYRVECPQGTYVLTLLEQLSPSAADRIADYVDYCYQHKVPCPRLVRQSSGQAVALFEQKPVTVVEFLPGHNVLNPSEQQCALIAKTLAQLHSVGTDYAPRLANTMDNAWRLKTYQKLKSNFSSQEQEHLASLMQLQETLSHHDLPQGMVHFDLFRDNALFEQGQLSGIIDFYYACYETLVFDLAITLNDWCTTWDQPTLALDPNKTRAFLDAYQAVRPLTPVEKTTLADHCQLACAHFWLARADTLAQAKQGDGLFEKDPNEFKKLYMAIKQAGML